jgi:chromosome segregation ATPase
MATDPRLAASRARPSANFNPPPIPQEKPTSPWIPFAISLLLLLACVGGLFFYIDTQFKSLESKLLKTNDFVIAMDKRLKNIEGTINSSNNEDASMGAKLLNLESRVSKAEKSVGWNASRIEKQITATEEVQSSVSGVSSKVNSQGSNISTNTTKIAELEQATSQDPSAALAEKVQTNTRAIETIDAHRSRMSSAIQKVQSDVARLIRLYEKDNPTAKRVQ